MLKISQILNPKTYKQLALYCVLLLVGGLIGYYLHESTTQITLSQRRANDPSLHYINPLLSCGLSENKEFSIYKPLEDKITSALSTMGPESKNTVSVYYKDFNSGRWFTINQDKTYSPASLLKVPIMIAYYKQAESDPSILNKKIYYSGDTVVSNDVEHYKSPHHIIAGNYYTIDELIASMIEYSDNAATVLLFQNINNSFLSEVITDIGLKTPTMTGAAAGTDDYMTVKSYAYLFRLLYNSTYLSREMSEKALSLLSEDDFTLGIKAGLPTDIKAAQKFGERTVFDKSFTPIKRELHDCGIIYDKTHPYILCIMTKGDDFDKLANSIKVVSGIVYDSVQHDFKN